MKKIILLTLAVLLNVSLFANNEVAELLEDAKMNERSGQFDDAIAQYLQVLEIEPNNYNATLSLGSAYHIKNDYVNALIYYNRAISIDSDNALGYFCRGNLQSDLGSTFGAINDYTAAIEIDPNDMQFYMCRGFAYSNLGDNYSAIGDYSIAIQLDPQSASSYYNMGKTQGIVSDIALACTELMKAKDSYGVRAETVYLNFCAA